MKFVAVVLMVCGLLYIVKPDLWRGGSRLGTDIAKRNLSPARYMQYMRGLGFFFFVLGAALLLANW